MFDNVEGLEEEIAMESQNRPWVWGCGAPVGEMPEKVHTDVANMYMVPEVVHGEVIEDLIFVYSKQSLS